jgi:hypothetical protein
MHLFRGFEPLGELAVAIALGKLPVNSKATAVSQKNLEQPKLNDKFII